MTRPNVLLITKGLGRGGAEHIVSSTALLGDRDRYRYEVAYILPNKHALVHELSMGAVPVHCLGGGRARWMIRLSQLVEDRDFDILHAHSPLPATVLRLQNLLNRRPLVYTEHNVWNRYHPATRWANALTFARSDHVFAVSEDVHRSITSSVFGHPSGRIETLVHGIREEFGRDLQATASIRREFEIDPETPLIVTVANFKPHKGHVHLLRAAAIVRKVEPSVRFLLVGVGPYERYVRSLTSRLGLEEAMVFAGFRDDVPRLVAAADLFVLPSEREGLPIALLEAMALGRATVATNVGGIPEVIRTEQEGILVPPGDPQLLANQIISLLEDPARRHRVGKTARVRAAHFDIRKAVRRMEDVYEGLLS